MDLGTGIAIGGVWLFPVACALSKNVSNVGMWVAILCAIVVTIVVL